ncbi:hypothetical protein FL857_05950 [Criibacterium bergeronii]|uniref:Uncharacterized protein n=1 Tax=Criibacterium bergeronii TaxID=1871336 RepID=A0A552V702_9FIRM|nr:hypothetical protein [Criibacterium bergeronii]TRW26228.1 hypothetical protein FL857_05950 [Criibacterium bergeronii]
MGITVTKDVNNVPKLLETIEKLKNQKIQVGILSKADGKMLMIATVHEFGCTIEVTDKMRAYLNSQGLHLKKDTKVINIPQRSFIRAGFDENEQNIISRMQALIEKVIFDELDINDFYEFIGNYCVGKLQEFLVNLDNPSLSSYTIEKKGSSNPLIDTGHLKDTITFEIV